MSLHIKALTDRPVPALGTDADDERVSEEIADHGTRAALGDADEIRYGVRDYGRSRGRFESRPVDEAFRSEAPVPMRIRVPSFGHVFDAPLQDL